ncbi:hypothetical protein [Streptomyces sp. NPDC053048]|uniref:hypothetical protein n=1 Tax=Streptomyces sp. NPDC053048 TaxID=3365694 RepID=UPI0037D721D5
MGLDITALIVDWAHLESIPADAREDVLTDAAYPDDDDGAHSWHHRLLTPSPPC